MDPSDELPDDLRELYAAERALPAALDAAARARVLAAVATAAPAAAAGFSLGTVIAASLASAVLGAGAAVGLMLVREPDAPMVATMTPVDAAPAAPVDATPAPDAVITPAMADASLVRPRTVPRPRLDAAPAPTPDRRELTAEERNLIDRARAALARGDAHQAMLALMEHERRYSDGALREDREYLVIVALVAQGKRDRATARADAYRRAFPRGTYTSEIDRLLATP